MKEPEPKLVKKDIERVLQNIPQEHVGESLEQFDDIMTATQQGYIPEWFMKDDYIHIQPTYLRDIVLTWHKTTEERLGHLAQAAELIRHDAEFIDAEVLWEFCVSVVNMQESLHDTIKSLGGV